MSFFISRVAPIFKNWQFQSISEAISNEDWMNLIDKLENLQQLEDAERRNLVSIQNPEYYIHLWHTERYGKAIFFSKFPERHKGELIKYLYNICQHLNANIYSLNNDGQTADKFNFALYQEEISKEYFPINEKKVTNVEVAEMMGLICIPTTNISSVASFLKLHDREITTWEKAVQKCYNPNHYMIRTLKGWTIVIGQLENLINKFQNELNQDKSEKEQFLDLLKMISSKFGRVSYNFNASKYSYFENLIAENGEMAYKYIHGDGEEEIEGEPKKDYFNDFMAFCFDESILEGIQLYE